jgi:sugar phosphate permease
LRRLLWGSTRVTCALYSTVGAVAMVVIAGPDVLAAAAAGFAVHYLAHGSSWPLLSAVLHTRVDAARRATAVSAMSLAMALGGIVGNLTVPPLVAAVSTEAGFVAVAVVVLLGAGACLRLPRTTVAEPSADDLEGISRPLPEAEAAAASVLRNAEDTRPH